MIELTPETRLEKDIEAIINDSTVNNPITRIEKMLAEIAAGELASITPVTRIEKYLAKISGIDVELPKPVTRIELFLAAIAGLEVALPKPITRLEYLLQGWLEDWGELTTLTGDVISFNAKRSAAINSLIVALEPIQDLHGQDSPYPAGGGKNLFDTNSIPTTTGTVGVINNGDGSITVTTSESSAGVSANNKKLSDYAPNLIVGEEYYLTAITTGTQAIFYASTALNFGSTFTLTQNIYDSVLYFYASGTSTTATVSDIMICKASEADKTYAPYENICPISGHTGAEVYDDPKYGGLIEWNQLATGGDFQALDAWECSGTDSTATVVDNCVHVQRPESVGGTVAFRLKSAYQKNSIENHKYLFLANVQTFKGALALFPTGTSSEGRIEYATYANRTLISLIWNGLNSKRITVEFRGYTGASQTTSEIDFTVENAMYFDLTQMFGAGNEPSTVEEFKALFPNEYYPYNAGEALNVGAVNGEPYRHVQVTFPDGLINQWDEETVLGYWASTGEFVSDNSRIATKNLIKVLPNTTYYIQSPAQTIFISFYDSDQNFIRRYADTVPIALVTTDSNAYYMGLSFNAAYGTTYNNDISVNYPSTAKSYYSYNSPVVYGGTLDIVSGTLTVDRIKLFNPIAGAVYLHSGSGLYYCVINISSQKGKSTTTEFPIYSNISYGDRQAVVRGISYIAAESSLVYVMHDQTLTTASSVNQFFTDNNVEFMYYIAEPFTVQLTPQQVSTLRGTNNLWDDGELEIKIPVSSIEE